MPEIWLAKSGSGACRSGRFKAGCSERHGALLLVGSAVEAVCWGLIPHRLAGCPGLSRGLWRCRVINYASTACRCSVQASLTAQVC